MHLDSSTQQTTLQAARYGLAFAVIASPCRKQSQRFVATSAASTSLTQALSSDKTDLSSYLLERPFSDLYAVLCELINLKRQLLTLLLLLLHEVKPFLQQYDKAHLP